MTPAEIEAKVRGAHAEALGNRFMQRRRSSRIDDLVRDARLYGREAGADFAETHLGRLVDEAVGVAGCKEGALELTLHGSGHAALETPSAEHSAPSFDYAAQASFAILLRQQVEKNPHALAVADEELTWVIFHLEQAPRVTPFGQGNLALIRHSYQV